MNYILNFFNMHPLVWIATLVILFTILMVVLVNKVGVKWINVTESIVLFIKNNLTTLGVTNNKLNLILNLMSQALTYSLIINSDRDIDTKVEDSVIFIKNLSDELSTTITDGEIKIIKEVFKLVFIFMDTLNIKPTSLKYRKMVKCNTKLMLKEIK